MYRKPLADRAIVFATVAGLGIAGLWLIAFIVERTF